jgi:non-ribosomal peptide synthetase component F
MTVTESDRNSWLNLDWSGLGEWSEFYRGINQTEFTLPASSRLVARVWEHVLATPTAVAVLDDAGALSYEAMWSDALAVHDDLLQAGVCPGDFVGVCCQRDRRLPGTLIGVWLAGAAYVPLDLEYPRERLQHVIEDTKLAVIVTDDRTAVAGLGGTASWSNGRAVYHRRVMGSGPKRSSLLVLNPLQPT